jgi:hypothetical protein
MFAVVDCGDDLLLAALFMRKVGGWKREEILRYTSQTNTAGAPFSALAIPLCCQPSDKTSNLTIFWARSFVEVFLLNERHSFTRLETMLSEFKNLKFPR